MAPPPCALLPDSAHRDPLLLQEGRTKHCVPFAEEGTVYGTLALWASVSVVAPWALGSIVALWVQGRNMARWAWVSAVGLKEQCNVVGVREHYGTADAKGLWKVLEGIAVLSLMWKFNNGDQLPCIGGCKCSDDCLHCRRNRRNLT